MEAAKRMDAADRNRNGSRHAGHDSQIEKDSATLNFPDINQLRGALIPIVAPPETEVTDMTPAATPAVLEGNHQRVTAGMFLQPAACLLVEGDQERGSH